jgi:hypothetical protein
MASRSCNKPMVKMGVERMRKIFGERHILCSSNCGISNICINVVTYLHQSGHITLSVPYNLLQK